MVQILNRFPAFLRHPDIPPDYVVADRDLFEAAVCGIGRTKSDVDVLCLFSATLRNDAELVLQTLRRLFGYCWCQGDQSFVGRLLCGDKEFCLRVAEEVSKNTWIRDKLGGGPPGVRQLL